MRNFMFFALLLVTYVFNGVFTLDMLVEGYYWRDFEGIIPKDALAGGLDRNGRPIYIGQVLFEVKLIPGKIYENDNKIYYEWGQKELTSTMNVKILCSQFPEKFEWVPTKYNEVVRLTTKLLVKGGYEPTYSTYIGRVYASGETSVGKVICRSTDCIGLYITMNGSGTEHREAFEVLTFNPQRNTSLEVKCPIDIRISPE